MPEEILKDLYRIQIPLPKSPLRILNSYVIKSDDRNLIIDTGFNHPECRQALLEGLTALDIDMQETDILLTHLHSDHTGLVSDIAEAGTRIYISRVEIQWMCGETRTFLWQLDSAKMLRAGFSREVVDHSLKDAAPRKMSADLNFFDYQPIDDGDVFCCGDYTLRAVMTPGHTPAHMCFWMEKQKTLFTGDHVLFDISPNITLWNFVDDSLGDYLESLKMIDSYDVRLALPGHRGTGDFHKRVAHLLEHHAHRLDECWLAVRDNPGASAFDIAGRMSWKIRCDSWEDFPISQKWFAVGECQSHLRHLERLGRVVADESGDVTRYTAV